MTMRSSCIAARSGDPPVPHHTRELGLIRGQSPLGSGGSFSLRSKGRQAASDTRNLNCGRPLVWFGLLVCCACPGCVGMASTWAIMTGGDVITAEFTLARTPLLVMIEDKQNLVEQPPALRELHREIADRFDKFNVNRRVKPFEQWMRFRQAEPKYDGMTIRQVGEKMGVDQVLYIKVERFTLQAEPGAPVYKGEFAARVRVCSTERKSDVRLWPVNEEQGRLVSVDTPAVSVESERTAEDVAAELGRKLGVEIAKLFYEHRSMDE